MNRSPESAGAPAPRILVVDDEEIVLVALRETLRQQGFQVDTASSAVQGLEAVRRQEYAVIITDQQMPMLTGLEFLAQVKKVRPDTTRILVTAVMNLNTVIEAINKAEIYRFLVKPWQREDLLGAVRGGVERHENVTGTRTRLAAALAERDRLAQALATLEKELKETETHPMTKRM